jgi:Arc/MetJ family transcription regulator
VDREALKDYNGAPLHHCIDASLTAKARQFMRTTLDIDDDLLAAAKELARREGATAGQVVSRLLRRSLTGGAASSTPVRARRKPVAGFVPFPAKAGVVVTNEQVDALRDAEGI